MSDQAQPQTRIELSGSREKLTAEVNEILNPADGKVAIGPLVSIGFQLLLDIRDLLMVSTKLQDTQCMFLAQATGQAPRPPGAPAPSLVVPVGSLPPGAKLRG